VTGPPEDLLRAAPLRGAADAALLAALARAAAALARLDQATDGPHPLMPALLHRARLDAVRRQAAADGFPIDPWHLAALVEGCGRDGSRVRGASPTPGRSSRRDGRRSPTTGR
jgi:hypothetical protein